MADSKSSLKSTPHKDRIREWMALARLSVSDRGNRDFSDLQTSFEQHDRYARQYLDRGLRECKVIEIGYGARPNRLIWFLGQGVDITGIDIDQPILHGSPAEFFQVYRQNGWERMLKTVGRWYINERHLRGAMLHELSRQQGEPVALTPDRLVVGDAASARFWDQHRGADYIFSEDVFEHIPLDVLEHLVPRMAASMSPQGVAYVKPMVWTGICGGHHVEWYPHTFGQPIERRTGPWEHLRQNRHPANTYVNRVTLAQYRELFARHFDVLEETCATPELGKQFMTPELREELSAYADDELYSNGVIFILRPKILQA